MSTKKLKERMNLIQRFIDHDDKLELQALFAVQALVHKLEHPAGQYTLSSLLLSPTNLTDA